MKLTVYLRVARGARGPRVMASAKPNRFPLTVGYPERPLPTAMFALKFDIPDEKFHEAERVLAELDLIDEPVEIAVEVDKP